MHDELVAVDDVCAGGVRGDGGVVGFSFLGVPVGVSAAVYAGALTVLLIVRSPGLWRSARGRVAVVLAALALAALVEETSTLGLLMIVVTISVLVLISQGALNPLADNVSTWFARWVGMLASMGCWLLRDNVMVARWLVRHPRMGGRMMRVATFLAWWVLPLIAGLIFAGLFALANPVIAQFFSHLQEYVNQFFDWLLRLSFLRMFMWLVVFVFAYGLLRYRWRGRRRINVAVPPVVRPMGGADWLTGPGMIIRVLLVLNLVFAVENVLDVAYLYFGVPLPTGMSYTSYAHRGAYTLIATALLAGAFTLAAFRHNGQAQHSKGCRWMVYAWIVQNIMLLVSTVTRVWIYVVTNELTRLRTSTMIWCVLVAMGFVWIILRIRQHRTNAWLWRMNALTTFVILFACAFVNFDGMIADYNVRHCAEAGGRAAPLDISYLRHLGIPSLPAVRWVQANSGPYTREQRAEIEDIAADLKRRLDVQLGDWRSWTYRRWRTRA